MIDHIEKLIKQNTYQNILLKVKYVDAYNILKIHTENVIALKVYKV